MPRYGLINERRSQLHEVIRLSGMPLCVNDFDYSLIIKVSSIPAARLQAYFIHCDDFFKRKSLYGPSSKGVNDNDVRAIFFARGVLETVKGLHWVPDVIHCHGAFTALAVLYIKEFYKDDPCFQKAKVVYSVYDEEEPVEMPATIFESLAFDKIEGKAVASMDQQFDFEALCRVAVANSDGVIQASPEVNSNVRSYMEQSGKPLMDYPGEEGYADAYNDFYNSL